jgi:DNA polymerase sigma
MRDWVADKVTLIIHELWPKADVRIYGSFHTNLYLPSRYGPDICAAPSYERHSDIDVVVIGAPNESNNQMALLQLADRLHARGETTMHVIPTAKVRDARDDLSPKWGTRSRERLPQVPIIKLIERDTNCMVDISFNTSSGPENTEIVRTFLREHAELRPLVLVLKYFLAQNRLNEPYWGGMGSYALVLLTTFIIKRRRMQLGGKSAAPATVASPRSSSETTTPPPAAAPATTAAPAPTLPSPRRSPRATSTTEAAPAAPAAAAAAPTTTPAPDPPMLNLGELLMDFFAFFGKELKTESEAVSVRNTSVFLKESRGWFDPANPLSYSVEDPQNAGASSPFHLSSFAHLSSRRK